MPYSCHGAGGWGRCNASSYPFPEWSNRNSNPYAHTDSNANTDSYADADTYADANPYTYTYTHTHAHADS
jgi:hypothetical protein